jgi:hypothetical protein
MDPGSREVPRKEKEETIFTCVSLETSLKIIFSRITE